MPVCLRSRISDPLQMLPVGILEVLINDVPWAAITCLGLSETRFGGTLRFEKKRKKGDCLGPEVKLAGFFLSNTLVLALGVPFKPRSLGI